ncbi:GGDEF domain-containing protein [Notoacmeibacter ruber]|nr:GGDEF domain-containing protein [Notoacmeibacter ruber]
MKFDFKMMSGARAFQKNPEVVTFRKWMARAMLVATGVTCVLVAVATFSGLWVLPDFHLLLTSLFGVLSLGLSFMVSRYPKVAIWSYIIGLALALLSGDFLVLNDEMRFAWHFPALAAAFVTGGLAGGLFILATALVSLTASTILLSAMSIAGLITFCVTLSLMALLIAIVEWRFFHTLGDLHASRALLSNLAHTDPLTGLSNRLAFDRTLQTLSAAGIPFSVILCDLDHFKQVNDTYGHAAGDKVLKSIAGVLKDTAQSQHMVARLGGEEFCLLLVEVELSAALELTENLRETIQKHTVIIEGQALTCTASFGLTHSSNQSDKDPSELLKAADQALYEAKAEGRNRSKTAPKPVGREPVIRRSAKAFGDPNHCAA